MRRWVYCRCERWVGERDSRVKRLNIGSRIRKDQREREVRQN